MKRYDGPRQPPIQFSSDVISRDRSVRRSSGAGPGSNYRAQVPEREKRELSQSREAPKTIKPVEHPKRPEKQLYPVYQQEAVLRRHGVSVGFSVTLFFLVLFGLIVLYAASFYQVQDSNARADVASTSLISPFGIDTVVKQVLCIGLGMLGMFYFANFDYHKLAGQRIVRLAVAVTLLLLGLVLIPGIGSYINGARRWFRVFGISVQPSEIAKFAVVIYMAFAMSTRQKEMRKISGIIPIMFFPLAVFGLIMLQPNMSSGGTILIVTLIMLIIGGMDMKYFFLMLVLGIAAAAVLTIIEPYRMDRLLSFRDPWAAKYYDSGGYQLRNSLIALGSGGLFGAGIGQGKQKYNFLPYPDSDFIFAVIGEDWGFFGCALVILVFLLLIYFGLKIAANAPDRVGGMLASGIVSVIGVQTALHILVVAGFFPTTGQPLPFFSSGGSAITIFLCAMGMLLNISRYTVDSYK